jgi:hypothetical protein
MWYSSACAKNNLYPYKPIMIASTQQLSNIYYCFQSQKLYEFTHADMPINASSWNQNEIGNRSMFVPVTGLQLNRENAVTNTHEKWFIWPRQKQNTWFVPAVSS